MIFSRRIERIVGAKVQEKVKLFGELINEENCSLMSVVPCKANTNE